MVHGDSMESYFLTIVIPDSVQLVEIASRVWKKPVSETDLVMLDEAVKNEKVVKDLSRSNCSLWKMVFYANDEDPWMCQKPFCSFAWWPLLLTRAWSSGALIRGINRSWIPCMHSASPNPRGRLSWRQGYGTPGPVGHTGL